MTKQPQQFTLGVLMVKDHLPVIEVTLLICVMYRLHVASAPRLQGGLSCRHCSSKTTAEVSVCLFTSPGSFVHLRDQRAVEVFICQDKVKLLLKGDRTGGHAPPYEKLSSLPPASAVACAH